MTTDPIADLKAAYAVVSECQRRLVALSMFDTPGKQLAAAEYQAAWRVFRAACVDHVLTLIAEPTDNKE